MAEFRSVPGQLWNANRRSGRRRTVHSGQIFHVGVVCMRIAGLFVAAVLVAFPVVSFAADTTPLVTAEWLKAHADDENVVIVDIRDKVARDRSG